MHARTAATAYYNAYILYGGCPLRRIDVKRHLDACGISTTGQNYFLSKPDLTADAVAAYGPQCLALCRTMLMEEIA